MAGSLSFDETPAQPPEVSGAMGGGPEKMPFSGVGAMMANKPPGPGGASPTGGIQAAADAVEKVIDNIAQQADVFKPYANRMKQIMKAGMAEVAKAGVGGKAGGGAGKPPEVSAKPPEAGVGPGFAG